MLPFIIGGKESVILQKPGQPKVGDVVLAWVNNSRYVVHRIIKIEGEDVTLMGDFTVESLAEKLCEEYEVSADEARKDVEEITGEWNSVGVID